MDLVGPDDLYAYMGDGGDYLYMDEWISGETAKAASDRFAAGSRALDDCAQEAGMNLIASSYPGLDELRHFERSDPKPKDAEDHLTVLYARNGGVILLLAMYVARNDKFDPDQREHLTEVALDKLVELGPVEVSDGEF